MGRKSASKDRAYITTTEWKESYGGARAGGAARAPPTILPFGHCALTFVRAADPVCAPDGSVFDATAIVPYVRAHGTHPVTGQPLSVADLTPLRLHPGAAPGAHACPALGKEFTASTAIVAVKTTGHVYCRDAVDELNVKPKNWTDLVDGTPFKRSDLITLQDPAAPRDASSFDHVKRGVTPAPVGHGSSSSVDASRVSADARRALGRLGAAAPGRGAGARDPRLQGPVRAVVPTPTFKPGATTWATDDPSQRPAAERKAAEKRVAAEREAVEAAAAAAPPTKRAPRPYDDPARHRPDAMRTAGAASKSFTSTAVAPAARGAADRASTRIYVNPTTKGYARLHTSVGDINFELHADLAPRACENFLTLAAAGYYDATPFHRVIKHFMAQGGDPTGTGAGGESIYGEPFADEVTPKLAHAARGVLSMANAGPGTNKSQFFVLFKSAPHLDGKHTVFGRAVGGLETLAALEAVAVDADDRPKQPVTITGVTVYVDPFAEEAKKAAEREGAAAAAAADGGARGAWFSDPGAAAAPAPSRTGVGKYLLSTAAGGEGGGGGGEGAPRAAKKAKAAAASAFDAW